MMTIAIQVVWILLIVVGRGRRVRPKPVWRQDPQESIKLSWKPDLDVLLGFKERLEREYHDFVPSLNWQDLPGRWSTPSPAGFRSFCRTAQRTIPYISCVNWW